MRRPRILIVPVGKAVGPWLERLMGQLAEAFIAQIELAKPIPYPLPAFNPARKRFFAHLIIDYLREVAGNVDFVVGLTDVELYSVHCNSVICETHFQARSAVISVGRLRDFLFGEKPEEVFYQRLYKEILRALGHMMGLPPCSNPHCVMYPSLSLYETDLKSSSFCPECLLKLRLRVGSLPFLRESG